MNLLKHIATFGIAAAILIGGPVAAFANFDAIGAKLAGVDTVSAATTIQDAPSGHYTILINRALHRNAEVLSDWVTFFSGEDAPLIMEDVDCMALDGDAPGIDMAKSLMSRLPENQMKLHVVDAVLGMSKADIGQFDVLVMSDEMYEALSADTVAQHQDVEVVRR